MWRHFLTRVSDGLLGAELDIPSFVWDMSVSDSSLSTTKQKGTGIEDVSSITVPWTAIPGTTAALRDAAIREGKVAVTSFWKDSGAEPNSLGTPKLWGIISDRTDTWIDTSFALDGIMSILGRRLVATEGKFPTADTIAWTGTAQAIAKKVVQQACSKPSGGLPIDFDVDQTVSTDPTLTLTVENFDTSNITAATLLTKLANLDNGPDIQFRPYLADSQHVRLKMLRGHPRLGQDRIHSFSAFPTGGTLQDFKIVHSASSLAMRVYGTGSGSDSATLMALAEDKTLVSLSDPWPTYEASYSDTSATDVMVLQSEADALLTALGRPLMQLQGTIRADGNIPLGLIWPGESARLSINGHPSLSDGNYDLRIMKMSGDQTASVTVVFDAMEGAWK